MKTKSLICIVCPNGCELTAQINCEDPLEVGDVTGCLCDKGSAWAKQELVNPMRTIASNILVANGDFTLVSVRTDAPIARRMIAPVMKAIKSKTVEAPVQIGDILIPHPAGTKCNIIATRCVKQA